MGSTENPTSEDLRSVPGHEKPKSGEGVQHSGVPELEPAPDATASGANASKGSTNGSVLGPVTDDLSK